MTNLIENIRQVAAKRIAYVRTAHEIESMPLDVALDLDINRDDARKIAHCAVYGK
jgi:hypothetical protein